MPGLTGETRMDAAEMVKASLAMVDVMRDVRSIATALASELNTKQGGMVGDDNAGHLFNSVYGPSSATALDQIGFSAYVIGQTGAGLMRTAREFIAAEDRAVAELLGKQQDSTAAMADPSDGCDQNFLNLGQKLTEAVGDTTWYTQYLGSARFRGDAEKGRDVAAVWRKAAKLLDQSLSTAQTCARTANAAHAGEAADAFDRYFKRTIGFADPPPYAHGGEPLVGNLVAACLQLEKACDMYADYIEHAERRIAEHDLDVFAADSPLDEPRFGGNGFDGGLLEAVSDDGHIRRLGDVPHALDASKARIRLPKLENPSGPRIPFIPVPAPVSAPVMVLASATTGVPRGYVPVDPGIAPRDPIPPGPDSMSAPYSAAEQARFRAWMESLRPAGFGNRRGPEDPDNAYQLRIAGYPERELPLPPESRGKSGKGMMADGIRPSDGQAVDAKYTRNEKCGQTFRTLDQVERTLDKEWKVDDGGKRKWNPRIDSMYQGDAKEMNRYHAAITYPPNQVNSLDIVSNDKTTVPYWQTMMALHKVPGDARYVP